MEQNTVQQPVQQPVGNTFKTPALVFAILSVTLFWIPLIGIGISITALILTIKARKRSRVLQSQPPEKFTGRLVMSIIGTAISGMFALISIIGFVAALSSIGGSIVGGAKSQTSYPEAVGALENAPKNFSLDQTAAFGPYNLSVRTQGDYMPTDSEVRSLQRVQQESTFDDEEAKTLPAGQAKYTKVAIAVNYAPARAGTYSTLSTSGLGWGEALTKLELDGYKCVQREPLVDRDVIQDLDYPRTIEEKNPFPVTFGYICMSDPAARTNNLELYVRIFTRVSPIVGTEGMPSKQYTYKISI